MDQTLSLYLLETLPLLDAESPDYALDVLTLVESILENPELILRRQLDRIKDRAVAQMKADGIEYEQRMEELEKLEYPKPLRDFVYDTFNAFADRHPWVGEENIRPKSIAREMFENFRSFAEYVLDYELQRSEGLLLRHLNSVYKVLSQTVPDGVEDRRGARDGAVPADAAAPGRLQPRRRVGADARPRLPAVRAAAAARRGAAAARRRDGRAGHHARREGVHRRDPDAHLHVPARVGHRPPRGRPRRARQSSARRDRRRRVDAGAAPISTRGLPRRPRTRSASIPRRATSGTRTSIRPTTGARGACSRCSSTRRCTTTGWRSSRWTWRPRARRTSRCCGCGGSGRSGDRSSALATALE